MPKPPVRASTILRRKARKRLRLRLRHDSGCKEQELRRALREAFAGASDRAPDLKQIRRVFRKFGVESPALQARVLTSLSRPLRMRFYCAAEGLPLPHQRPRPQEVTA